MSILAPLIQRFVFIQVSLYYGRCLRDHQFFKNYLSRRTLLSSRYVSIKLVVVYEVLWVSLIWEKCIIILFIYILSTSTKWMLCCHADMFIADLYSTLQNNYQSVLHLPMLLWWYMDSSGCQGPKRTVRMPEKYFVLFSTLTHPSHIHFRFLTILPWYYHNGSCSMVWLTHTPAHSGGTHVFSWRATVWCILFHT